MGKKTGRQLPGVEVISKAREALRTGRVHLTPHFQESCTKRTISLQMILEAVQSDAAEVDRSRTEYREGLGWKYRIVSEVAGFGFVVVVSFGGEHSDLIFITAFFLGTLDGVAPDELRSEL